MTYAEVREMYTLDMVRLDDERKALRESVKESMAVVSTWILPWSLTALSILLSSVLSSSGKASFLFLLAPVSVLLKRVGNAEDVVLRSLSVALSYLFMIAAVLTVFPF